MKNMASKKSKQNLKKRIEKVDTIYQDFLKKIGKLKTDREKLVTDFMAHANREEIEKLKKDIDSLYR